MTQEFLDDGNGHVSGVKTVTVEWEKDAAGRWQMKPKPDSEQTFKADLVLLAMGFLGPERAVANELELKLDARSNFDTKEYQTSVNNVFAAGGKNIHIDFSEIFSVCTLFKFMNIHLTVDSSEILL